MKAQAREIEKPSFWQLVFLHSKVNGAPYTGELLSPRSWQWPEDTYLQRRLKDLRQYQPSPFIDSHQIAA